MGAMLEMRLHQCFIHDLIVGAVQLKELLIALLPLQEILEDLKTIALFNQEEAAVTASNEVIASAIS